MSRIAGLLILGLGLIGIISCQALPVATVATTTPFVTALSARATALPTLLSTALPGLLATTPPTPFPTSLPTLLPTRLPSPLASSTTVLSLPPTLTVTPRPTVANEKDQARNPARPANNFATSVPPAEPFDLFIHFPPNVARHQPVRVLIALHGMGAQGEGFAQNLIGDADANGWVLIAPTIPYHNWLDMKELLEDDVRFTQTLHLLVQDLPKRLHLQIQPQVFLFGFSRGAQLAHRFALFYPEQVSAVVAISAGSYTLPVEQRKVDAIDQTLPLPYGVGDLQKHVARLVDWEDFKKIDFLIGVGEKDNRAGDVPRAFDPYIGNTRIERARAFNNELLKIGVKSQLIIFSGADHEVTAEMRQRAVNFLGQAHPGNLPIAQPTPQPHG